MNPFEEVPVPDTLLVGLARPGGNARAPKEWFHPADVHRAVRFPAALLRAAAG